QAREHPSGLEGPRHPEGEAVGRGHPGDVRVPEPDLSGVGLDHSGEQLDESGLPGTVGPDDGGGRPRLDVEGEVGTGMNAAIGLAEVRYTDHWPATPETTGDGAAAFFRRRAPGKEIEVIPDGRNLMTRMSTTP